MILLLINELSNRHTVIMYIKALYAVSFVRRGWFPSSYCRPHVDQINR